MNDEREKGENFRESVKGDKFQGVALRSWPQRGTQVSSLY